MLNLISRLFGKEKFENFKNQESFPVILAVIMSVYICVSGVFLMYLWNNYAVKYVSGLKPINNFLDAIFLKLLFTLLAS